MKTTNVRKARAASAPALRKNRKVRDRWGPPEWRKEHFLRAVFFLAMARDMQNETTDAQRIMNFASRIAAKTVPPLPRNAALVFMRFVDGNPRSECRWMSAFEEMA